MSQPNDDQTTLAIKSLFDWSFRVQIPDGVMDWVVLQLRQAWNDGDQSEQQLIAYLAQLSVHLSGMDEAQREANRGEVQGVLRDEFSRLELNDRGRVLMLFRGILETLRPGCTHPPAVVAATTAPAAQPAAQGSLPPMGTLLTGAAQQPQAAPQPAQQRQAAPQPDSMPGVDGMLQQQMDMQRSNQLAMMQAKMMKAEHDTIMSIINAM